MCSCVYLPTRSRVFSPESSPLSVTLSLLRSVFETELVPANNAKNRLVILLYCLSGMQRSMTRSSRFDQVACVCSCRRLFNPFPCDAASPLPLPSHFPFASPFPLSLPFTGQSGAACDSGGVLVAPGHRHRGAR